jgi:hypothetical protein
VGLHRPTQTVILNTHWLVNSFDNSFLFSGELFLNKVLDRLGSCLEQGFRGMQVSYCLYDLGMLKLLDIPKLHNAEG